MTGESLLAEIPLEKKVKARTASQTGTCQAADTILLDPWEQYGSWNSRVKKSRKRYGGQAQSKHCRRLLPLRLQIHELSEAVLSAFLWAACNFSHHYHWSLSQTAETSQDGRKVQLLSRHEVQVRWEPLAASVMSFLHCFARVPGQKVKVIHPENKTIYKNTQNQITAKYYCQSIQYMEQSTNRMKLWKRTLCVLKEVPGKKKVNKNFKKQVHPKGTLSTKS